MQQSAIDISTNLLSTYLLCSYLNMLDKYVPTLVLLGADIILCSFFILFLGAILVMYDKVSPLRFVT